MTFTSRRTFGGVVAAAVGLLALCATAPAGAQLSDTFTTLPATHTSSDGLLTLVLSAANPPDAVGINNTYTWTAINNSPTKTLTGVILGSHWGDWCPGGDPIGNSCGAPPTGPTLVSLAPGCGGQSISEFPAVISHFGVWCTPSTGVTLAPGQSVSGSVTLRPGTGGPAFYGVYSRHDASGVTRPDPVINYRGVVAPAATDIQLTGHASNGSPPAGATFTYTYQIKNAGPWGTYDGIIFADTLPASLTYVSSSVVEAGIIDASTGQLAQQTNPIGCSAAGQTVVCPLEDMTNGGLSGQFSITLTVTAAGAPQQIVNTATVHTVSPQEDSNNANNSVTVTVTTK